MAKKAPEAGVGLSDMGAGFKLSLVKSQDILGEQGSGGPPEDPPAVAGPAAATEPQSPEVPEFGGRDGPDPTRYGDWEKNGRCIDF
ncbi:DUF1674 domain-containing protein [Luteimonas composti]|uniref:DUF1674 domain-containing protein n=1 Tax=Luteimonas composti TaxID=398257 RepID=A0ABT6MLZ0_9GAMM|nr:succinate dehydrogenase assembly factor 4 [Luteimonas composti]MDH7451589.1 DUF1674 domain-containing protein [Luteimonas composti]